MDDFEYYAGSDAGVFERAVSEAGDQTDEISEKIDRLENTFFDEPEDEDEFDDDAVSEAGLIAPAASEAGDQTDEISEKIDRLENTFFDEPEGQKDLEEDSEPEAEAIGSTVSEAGEEPEEEDIEASDAGPSGEPPADGSLDALTGASREQIEKSIERIILNNFSDKIESIVTETIEKAVSKEIDRLKNILLEDGGDENF